MKRHAAIVGIVVVLMLLVSGVGFSAPYDFGGETVTIVMWGGDRAWQDSRAVAHLEDVQERFNVEIRWETTQAQQAFVDQVAQFVLEGNENVILFGQNQWMNMAAAEGLLYPLDEVLGEEYYDNMPSMVAGPFRSQNKFRGTSYGFLTQMNPPIGEIQGIIWNKDLFEEEGFPNLYELYEAGEWTWEVFRDIALRATKDTSGDGEVDQWGVTTRMGGVSSGQFYALIYHFAHANGGELIRTVDGRDVFAFTEPQALAAMELWKDLNDNMAIASDANWIRFVEGDVAMDVNILGQLNHRHFVEIEFNFGFVPLPLGPEGTEYAASNRLFWLGMLPATVKNPEALIELYNALYEMTPEYEPFVNKPDYRTLAEWEEAFWTGLTLNLRDRESLDTINWMIANVRPMTYWQILEGVPGFTDAVRSALTGAENPTAAMSAIAPAVQARIDEALGQ